jgi:asparagine synthase (glutamine-hydrolysing)
MALQRLYPYLTHSPAASGRLSARWWATTEADWQDPLLPLRSRMQLGQRFAALLNPAAQARWVDTWEPAAQAGLRAELPARMDSAHGLARAQHLECKGLLASYLLSSQGDRVAMAEGLELRHPYLDHRVAESLAALPRAWLLRGLRDKRLLREALRPCVPAELLARPKQPYRAPDVSGLLNTQGQLPEPLEALVTPERLRHHAFLDGGAVGRLLAKCRSGRAIGAADHQAFVTLLSLLSWQRQFGVDEAAA